MLASSEKRFALIWRLFLIVSILSKILIWRKVLQEGKISQLKKGDWMNRGFSSEIDRCGGAIEHIEEEGYQKKKKKMRGIIKNVLN